MSEKKFGSGRVNIWTEKLEKKKKTNVSDPNFFGGQEYPYIKYTNLVSMDPKLINIFTWIILNRPNHIDILDYSW